jgi:hypothetical protein
VIGCGDIRQENVIGCGDIRQENVIEHGDIRQENVIWVVLKLLIYDIILR